MKFKTNSNAMALKLCITKCAMQTLTCQSRLAVFNQRHTKAIHIILFEKKNYAF